MYYIQELLFTYFLHYGGLAQLGERLPYKQDVSGSIPLTSIVMLIVALAAYEHDELRNSLQYFL